jgi:hypothetical protein
MAKSITIFCKVASLNWNVLPELESRLLKIGLNVKRLSIEIRRYPTSIEYDAVENALEDIRVSGEPTDYSMWFYGDSDRKLHLWRTVNIWDKEVLAMTLEEVGSVEDVQSLAGFIGLTMDTIPASRITKLARTCFIAYRFNDPGTELAGKLTKFLELLDFKVRTGRDFAPGSVSAKVRARMNQQAIVFAILTAGEDDTWLTQESLLGSSEKPLFLLKEKQFTFKAALHGDHEYIPFAGLNIETTFIPIMEGLRDIGYKL